MNAITAPADAALVVSDVQVTMQRKARTTEILRNVDFEVSPQEFLVLMGPSGCGKSTLLKLLAGFEPPTSGSISRGGLPVDAPGPDRGMVFQSPCLYPWLNVLDNVLFGPRMMGGARHIRDKAYELIREVGLEGFETHMPYELSGGMRHRAALARTLMNEPPVLLMDEPFAALDAQTREDMQELLLRVWERHKSTVVFVTHDIEEGLLLGDRILVMSSRPGRIREAVEVPFARPRDPGIVASREFSELRVALRAMLH